MAEVVWTEPALDDLHDIAVFIAKDSPVYAERFAAKVVQAPTVLKEHGAYRVIYKVAGRNCYIVAVVHGSRDILKRLAPGEWDIL